MTSTSHSPNTIVAIATSPGRAAIAIIKISGPDSLAVLCTLTHRHNFHPRRATLVCVYDQQGDLLDQSLALYFKAPHSYTGEDVVEIQCHGGVMVAKLILQACLQAGAHLAQGGEFSRRAFLNGRMDFSQIQALGALLEANNARMVKAMAKQLRGSLKDFVHTTRQSLLELLASSEVLIDYAEEDLPLNLHTGMQTKLKAILQDLQGILEVSKNTKLEGYLISLVGKPNVGKSSLLNALLLKDRALVSPIAGTTRDTIEESLELEGLSLRLIDTAGIRTSQDSLEKLGIAKSVQSLQESDIILALFDLSKSLEDTDAQIIDLLLKYPKPLILIFNKSDCPQKLDVNAILTPLQNRFNATLTLSTTNPTHCLQSLRQALKPLLEDNPHDTLICASLTQQQSLQATIAHLQGASSTLGDLELELFSYHLQDALKSLATITQPYNVEDMLDSMFTQFCLGK
ncbi:tRNA uridine-5-carboxymethylaminomethyl(34) synthesis GTPase MnmE [Helicobacter cynogastricus]|uniref:tRNA uridine-5-carboxymethylaminomethyl(34) synthesis GTPase MnmE n=1 Tax=Helicobacter cynogastricus TaxID=329937 RepID=UPI000CF10C05|nr:tRNA uridine-5-carboxymethylaminomethyl(34) synthesis GTPase MnmE [Helicobacter cynogastricus]